MRAYVHVPFCAARCGYCDFNTYTPSELGGLQTSAYVQAVQQEIDLAGRVAQPQPLASVFIGGGTPSLLSAADLGGLLQSLREVFGLAAGAEVTLEANPENVDAGMLDAWLSMGITRLSLGMQSADPAALAVLDRVHTPGAAVAAATSARQAGFEHVSLDLIYGVPGLSTSAWEQTVLTALEAQPDHISAYALGVETGTALYRKVARGEVTAPDPDAAAEHYRVADEVLGERGLHWYEISNWSTPDGQCRHNVGYWHSDNWWGFGPGAHSHVDGVRWWNVKHPAAYQGRIQAGLSPAAARETLDTQARHMESVMLQVRLAEGFTAEPAHEQRLLDAGWAERADGARLRLTREGRMLADAVTRVLLGWD